MAMSNPKGRANYEPNSWGPEEGGPRESAQRGFVSQPETLDGEKLRARAESFADHYSQARQFYISQTPVEQRHIAEALIFELSKCEMTHIRERVVSHLLNIDKGLATGVAEGLGLDKLPKAAPPAVKPRDDLEPSDALSILKNGPQSFAGRKIGVLIADGFDNEMLSAINAAAKKESAVIELIAPKIGKIKAADGALAEPKHKIDGGPSVIFDAVILLVPEKAVDALIKMPPVRDFICDAYAHYKFIGFTEHALKLFGKAGVKTDEGFVAIDKKADAALFIKTCRSLRFWGRADGA